MLEVSSLVTEKLLECEGIPVIKLTVTTPVVSGGRKRAVRRINAFYSHITDAVGKHFERHMLRHASVDFNDAVAKSRPFEPYRIKVTFDAIHTKDGKTLEINRRLYIRAHKGVEHERVLTECWSTQLGLPEKLQSKTAAYSSSSDITDISYAVRSSAPSSVAFM